MAATGTPTPNIGLRIPQGTDPASVDDINYNSNLLDTKLGAVGNTSVQDQIDSLNSKLATIADVSVETSMSSVSCASGSFTTIDTFVPPSNGIYAFVATLDFGSDTTGNRIILVDTVETNSNNSANSILVSGRAVLQKTRFFRLTTSDRVYIRGYQNSGSSFNVGGSYRYIKINA